MIRAKLLAAIAGLCLAAPLLSHAQDEGRNRGRVIRVIDDAATGDRWLLIRDAAHPGGPGKMVRTEIAAMKLAGDRSKAESEPAKRNAHATVRLVIRAGDRVIVEEHTPVVDARLEAVALESAKVETELPVRLKIGGKVVRVVALASGEARLADLPGARP
ncbi:MAG TPA: hypothetical protein VGG45_00820 [Terracidiphilus sp.]